MEWCAVSYDSLCSRGLRHHRICHVVPHNTRLWKAAEKSRRPARLDCEFGGVRYRSIGAMARALGIGWSKARSFAEEVHRCEIEYAGKKYHSMTALAAAYHLTDTCCIYRLRHDIPLEAPDVRGEQPEALHMGRG